MPAPLPTASQPVVTVYTKTTWAGSWAEQPLMLAMQIVMTAAPSQPSATLRYRYGKTIQPPIGSRPKDSTPATIARGGFIGNYVKIDVAGLGIWYGVIIDNKDHRAGLLNTTTISGTEVYTAFGLTWFLDQAKPVIQSKVKYSGGTWMIDRAIPFNGGTDGRRGSTRVSWKNYDTANKCFSDFSQTTAPTKWTAANAIEYIIDNFGPKNAAGSVLIPFTLHSSALTFLDYEVPMLQYDGMTPWAIISRLVDRRRGLGMTAAISGSNVELKVFSQNAASITLPGNGGTIPANPNTTTYNFDNSVNITDAQVTTTLVTRYDQIVVRGERAGSVFTVRPQTNFEPDWTTVEKQSYNDAAKNETAYTLLGDSDKEAANQDRRAEDSLAKVFSWWKPKSTWNGRSDSDPSTGTAPYAFPSIDADGVVTLTTPANVQRAGLRVLPHLPLRQGINYSSGQILPTAADGDKAEADFLPPMLFFQGPIIRASTTDAGWVHCERLNAAVGSNSSKRPFSYSVDLAVRDDAPGLVMKVNGKPQHYICQELFVPDGSFESIASEEGINSNKWLATIYMQQDQYCRAQWPLNASLPSLDLIRPLHLHVAEAYLDYVVPGTIVGVKAGALQKSALGGYIRDDRKRLQDIARLAFAWYGQTRKILSLSFKGITSGFDIGDLITSIGTGGFSETINTCITSVTYDLQGGTTSLNTQFGELDFTV